MIKVWSVELADNNYNDDVFVGNFYECMEYCAAYDLRPDGINCRLAKLLVDYDGTVLKLLRIFGEKRMIKYSVEHEANSWMDDEYMGTIQECINYCREKEYEVDGSECRIVEVEVDFKGEVVEVLEIYNTIPAWADTVC